MRKNRRTLRRGTYQLGRGWLYEFSEFTEIVRIADDAPEAIAPPGIDTMMTTTEP
jgi:hypothetical protein